MDWYYWLAIGWLLLAFPVAVFVGRAARLSGDRHDSEPRPDRITPFLIDLRQPAVKP